MPSTNKTGKLKLSQFIGSDQPKWLTDYNGDMQKVDNYIGSVARTATVVVGLADSGYKAEQVDLLIPSGTADCNPYISQAIGRLPAHGGEVKLLDGVYNVTSSLFSALNGVISGCGDGTVIRYNGSGNIVWQFDALDTAASGRVQNLAFECGIQPTATFVCIRTTTALQSLTVSGVSFDLKNDYVFSYYHGAPGVVPPFISFLGCRNLKLGGVEKNNWYKIFVDGVAQYIDRNVGFSNASSNARYGSYNFSRTVAIYTYSNGMLHVRGEIWATNGLAIKSAFAETDTICITLPGLPSGTITPDSGLFKESSFTTGFYSDADKYLITQLSSSAHVLYFIQRNVQGSGLATFSQINQDTVIVTFDNMCLLK